MSPSSFYSLCIFTCLVASSFAEPVALGGEAGMKEEEVRSFLMSTLEALGEPARRTLAMDETATCILDVSQSSGYLVQAGLRMWEAVKYCKKASSEAGSGAAAPGQNAHNDLSMCITDMGLTTQLLTDVASSIMTILESCAKRDPTTDQCIKDAFSLAGSVATVGGTSVSMAHGCKVQPVAAPVPTDTNMAIANCVVNAQSAMQSLVGTISTLLTIKKQCEVPEQCATASLGVVSALADLSGFVIEAVGSCSARAGAVINVPCGTEAASAVKALTSIAATATTVKTSCQSVSAPATRALAPLRDALEPAQAAQVSSIQAKLLETSRLFELSRADATSAHIVEKNDQKTLPVQPILIGFIALTAMVSFSIGMRTSSVRRGVQVRDTSAEE